MNSQSTNILTGWNDNAESRDPAGSSRGGHEEALARWSRNMGMNSRVSTEG